MFIASGVKVFIYHEAIDMRCGFERLSYFVKEKMSKQINQGHLFLFLGKNRRRLKLLFYDGSGLVLLSKRMEKERFMSIDELDTKEITRRDLRYILHGSVLRQYRPEKS